MPAPKIPKTSKTAKIYRLSNAKNSAKQYANPKIVQNGFALAAVMLILLVTALIASTAVKTGLMNENLAQSQASINQAKANADSTLADAIDNVLCKNRTNGAQISNSNMFDGKTPFNIAANTCNAQGLCGPVTDINNPVWSTLHRTNPSVGSANYGELTGANLINTNLGRYLIESVQTTFPTGNAQNAGSLSIEYQYRITAVGFSQNNPRIYKKLQAVLIPKMRLCSYSTENNIFNDGR